MLFEGLTQQVKQFSSEFRQLIHKQDSPVGEGDLAGHGDDPSPDQGGAGDRMVGRQKGPVQNDGSSLGEGSRNAVDGRDLHTLFKAHGRENARHAPGQHGFPCSRRPRHQHVVKARRRDLHCLFGEGLAPHILEIGTCFRGASGIERVDIYLCGRDHPVPPVGCRTHIHDQLIDGPHADHPDPLDDCPLGFIFLWQDAQPDPLLLCTLHNGQDAPHRPDLTVQTQLTRDQNIFEVLLTQELHADELAHGDRQVNDDASLGDVRGGQVHSDPGGRGRDPRVFQGDTDPFAGLPHLRAHESDHMEGGETA